LGIEGQELLLLQSEFPELLGDEGLVPLRNIYAERPVPVPNIYGCLTRSDLKKVQNILDKQGPRFGTTVRSADVQTVLAKLDAVGAEAVDYTPTQLRDLPKHLLDLAFRILLLFRRPREPLEVTQDDLDWFMSLPTQLSDTAAVQKVRELAQHVGLKFKVREPGGLRKRN